MVLSEILPSLIIKRYIFFLVSELLEQCTINNILFSRCILMNEFMRIYSQYSQLLIFPIFVIVEKLNYGYGKSFELDNV